MTLRVLVTGGAGYIGSHTCKVLAEKGHVPVSYDSLECGHRWAVKWGPFVEADLADGAALRETLTAQRIDAVIHFAAYANVEESVRNPRKYFQNNVVNSLRLLDAMQDTGVAGIVFSSTCAIYGVPREIPLGEDHVQAPVSPYGESKLFTERSLRRYEEAYGLKWVSLRYFNAAGADPGGEIGEHHDPETHLIPVAIQAALGERESMELYGTDYPTPDGTAVRDYVHVTDLADAHVKALEQIVEGGESMAFNLGTGRGHSVREVVAAVERVSGQPVFVREAARRTGDPASLVARADLATRILEWRPKHTEIDGIVKTALQWHQRAGGRSPAKAG
jgi:UDP-glucose-4-epimerase GalE